MSENKMDEAVTERKCMEIRMAVMCGRITVKAVQMNRKKSIVCKHGKRVINE